MNPRIANFAEDVLSARDASAAIERFREGFGWLRVRFDLHPDPALRASEALVGAARVANAIAADCLPLALGVVMHFYPLCALQAVPLPAPSRPWLRRRRIVRAIRRHRLILANAGSERTAGENPPVVATKSQDGIVIDGAFDYVSLASVADLVLFEARLANGGIAVCAADTRAPTVTIGAPRFRTGMRLSDTRPMTFRGHLVPHDRCFVIPPDTRGADCVRSYQRCWFHLLLAEIHQARVESLSRQWRLDRSRAYLAVREDIRLLRRRCLGLIDAPFAPGNLESLMRASAAMKLAASRLAQTTAARLRELGAADEDASELTYIRQQPTADSKILQLLRESTAPAISERSPAASAA